MQRYAVMIHPCDGGLNTLHQVAYFGEGELKEEQVKHLVDEEYDPEQGYISIVPLPPPVFIVEGRAPDGGLEPEGERFED